MAWPSALYVRDRLLVRRPVAGVAVEDRLRGHADARGAGEVRRAEGEVAERIGRIRPFDQAQHERGIVDGQRQDRDAVELRQAGTTPRVLTRPGVGFRPTMLLKAGRHAARAGGVGAERERHVAARHGHRRARARAAADEIGVEDAARPAVGRARADEAGRELVEIGLADADGAGGDQLLDRGGVRRAAHSGRPGRRRSSASRRRRCCP